MSLLTTIARNLAAICSFVIIASVNAQQPVEVTDQKIKISAKSSEELLFAFAAGDQVVFNFSEINKKDLKELEILEYPNVSKFAEYKIEKITDKRLSVTRNTVLVFRFKNSSFVSRICHINIQRIPASRQTQHFNPAVVWKMRSDTTWNTVIKNVAEGYDTVYNQTVRKVVVRKDTLEELIIDKIQRVHSVTNGNGNTTSISFLLPVNVNLPNNRKRVIGWAYWIAVGDEARKAWEKNLRAVQKVAIQTAPLTPLGALITGVVTELIIPTLGEDVIYAITDEDNRNLFINNQTYRHYGNGKGPGGVEKVTHPALSQGRYFICLSNDNFRTGVDATVKVLALVEQTVLEDKAFTDMEVTPRYRKEMLQEPSVRQYRFPFPAD
ncbi:hypothetical protein [Terrimonas ferruginea]|uniref:hypothetical protein n=1 Tax=Terrimonas ferruginea TaxID=249 RepID=UPI000403F2F1|nr:hypothetical protein [Terrimonas ferruginea]